MSERERESETAKKISFFTTRVDTRFTLISLLSPRVRLSLFPVFRRVERRRGGSVLASSLFPSLPAMSGWLFGRGGGGAGGASAAAPPSTSNRHQAAATFSAPSPSAGAAVPLQLVRVSADGQRFELGEEALRVLRSLRGPVAVAAVAGRARQGKSSLLNGLLRTATGGKGKSPGFEVGPTTRPTTKGLWIWGAPIEVESAGGARHHLVLLDTEGIDAVDQTGSYSAGIFSLALLLSSLLVLNQLGPIDEAALDRLSLVAALTRRIRVRADEGGGGGGATKRGAPGGSAASAEAASADAELSEFTPSFLWLLRDFYLQLADDRGRSISADDYLEQCLAPTPEGASGGGGGPSSASSEGAASKNEVRAAIKRLFPRRGAAALVRPVADERDLQRLDALPESALRPEFRQGMRELTDRVLSLAAPKRLGRSFVTGPALAALAQAYVAAINGGAVPSIASAWAGVAEAECRAAADAAENVYRETFAAQLSQLASSSSNSPASASASLPPTAAAVDRAHAAALAAGERAYSDRALGDDERVRAAGDAAWRGRAEGSYSDFRARAEAEGRALAAGAAAAAGAEVAAFVARPESTLEGLAGAVSRAEEAFAGALGGRERCSSSPAAAAQWASFLSGPAAAAARSLAGRDAAAAAARASAAAEAASAELRAEALGSSRRVRELEAELSAARARAHEASLAATGAEAGAAARAAELAREAERLRSELAAAEARAGRAEQEARALAGRLEASGRRVAELEAAAAVADAAASAAALRPPPPPPPVAAPPPPPPPPSSSPSPSLPPLDGDGTPSTMTVAALKQWLVDAGRGEEAWRLSNERAKKGAFVAAVEAALRGG